MDAFDNAGETFVSSQETLAPTKSCEATLRETYVISQLIPDTKSLPLHQIALGTLKAFFDARGHRPSAEMWTALTELASVLEDMAEGRCPPKMFLSSLDPGVGKTQTVIQFVRALLASEAHQDVGVLLCMSRLDEIGTVADEMALSPTDYAVLTSDRELNKRGLGSTQANEARVLFTTQHASGWCGSRLPRRATRT